MGIGRLAVVLTVLACGLACTAGPEAVAGRAFVSGWSSADRCERDAKHITETVLPLIGEESPVDARMRQLTTTKSKGMQQTGDKAVVTLEVTSPTPSAVFALKEVGAILEYLGKSPAMSTSDVDVSLEREAGKWVMCQDLKRSWDERKAKDTAESIERLRKAGIENEVVVAGETEDDVRASLCEGLTAKLPLRGALRSSSASLNSMLYGCPENPPLVMPPSGFWRLRTEARLIDGSNDVFASIGEGDEDSSENLIVRCKHGSLDIFFTTKHYVGDEQNIRLKFGQAPVTKWWMSKATDGTALFFSRPRDLLRALQGVDDLVVEYSPYSKADQEMVFHVKGIDAVIAAMPQKCR